MDEEQAIGWGYEFLGQKMGRVWAMDAGAAFYGARSF